MMKVMLTSLQEKGQKTELNWAWSSQETPLSDRSRGIASASPMGRPCIEVHYIDKNDIGKEETLSQKGAYGLIRPARWVVPVLKTITSMWHQKFTAETETKDLSLSTDELTRKISRHLSTNKLAKLQATLVRNRNYRSLTGLLAHRGKVQSYQRS